MISTMLFFTCLFSWCLLFHISEAVTVDTKHGPVVGQTHEIHDGSLVNSFLGVPFARSTALGMRWQPPEEPDPWEEPFIADTLGTACSQEPVSLVWLTHPLWMRYGEDCLNLNVYTPEDMSGGPYPTMVWFYGGGYQQGANFQYPGYFLAAKGVVYVAVNYRLGILGFATTEDDVAPGNYGLLDQQFGLVWVQENIREFGGDPDDVTIFGESAGASATGFHLMSPMSAGLFHKAILQSGTELNSVAAPGLSDSTRGMGEELGCPTEDNQELMNCLRTFSPASLREAHRNCSTCRSFRPVVDGEGGFIPDYPENIRASGNFSQVPEIVGYNREDSFLWMITGPPGSMEDGYNRSAFIDAVKDLTPEVEDPELQEQVDDAYLFYYSPWPHLDDGELNRYMVGMIRTDSSYGGQTDEQLRSHTQYAPTYQYVLAYISSNASAIFPEWLGCFHIIDLTYIFGFPMLELEGNEIVKNESELYNFLPWNDLDTEYSDFMSTLWTNFGKYSDPTPEPVDAPAGMPPVTWLPFTETDHNYILMDRDVIETRQNYRSHEVSFWNYYLDKIIPEDDRSFQEHLAFDFDQAQESDRQSLLDYILFNIFDDIIPDLGYNDVDGN